MIRKRRRSKAPLPTVFLPQELIAEILLFLNVKTIVRFKYVSKSWNTLISHSDFVQKHLKNSSQNQHLTLVWHQSKSPSPLLARPCNLQPFPVHRILKNPSINVYRKYFHPLEQGWKVVGSCNALVCLLLHTRGSESSKYNLRFLNPATRMRTNILGFLTVSTPHNLGYKFTFGYDASTRTYKVVAVLVESEIGASLKTRVKVFNLRDSCWRNIQSFPVVPLNGLNKRFSGVHLSGTINWMAMVKAITHIEQFVIVSLDLSTETYKQFLIPPGFYDVPFNRPVLRVLTGSLCFFHDSEKTEFVLWQMKEYGVQESWTQLFKISYQNLQLDIPMNIILHYGFQLVCLYINGDMVIFAVKIPLKFRNRAFIYNLKDNTVQKIKCENCMQWFEEAKDYVESLVSVPWQDGLMGVFRISDLQLQPNIDDTWKWCGRKV